MSPVADGIVRRLDATRQRWWIFSLLCNVLLVTFLSLAMLVTFILADVCFLLSQTFLAAMFLLWCIATATLLAGTAYRILRGQRSIEAAAFDFPIVGRVPYKGFFDPERAQTIVDRFLVRMGTNE